MQDQTLAMAELAGAFDDINRDLVIRKGLVTLRSVRRHHHYRSLGRLLIAYPEFEAILEAMLNREAEQWGLE